MVYIKLEYAKAHIYVALAHFSMSLNSIHQDMLMGHL